MAADGHFCRECEGIDEAGLAQPGGHAEHVGSRRGANGEHVDHDEGPRHPYAGSPATLPATATAATITMIAGPSGPGDALGQSLAAALRS